MILLYSEVWALLCVIGASFQTLWTLVSLCDIGGNNTIQIVGKAIYDPICKRIASADMYSFLLPHLQLECDLPRYIYPGWTNGCGPPPQGFLQCCIPVLYSHFDFVIFLFHLFIYVVNIFHVNRKITAFDGQNLAISLNLLNWKDFSLVDIS